VTAQVDMVIRHLRRAVLRQDGAGCTDGQLLASFIDQKDEAAFEALVNRHGPMVFGVCRRVAGNHHDAEDAFQVTFLVLARKASSVRPRERVASWLHGVALRTAMKAKTMTAKRRGREQQVREMPEPEAAQQGPWRDLQPLLDQELNRLPEYYRLPILLCDLQGMTIKDAAQQLGWPQGSLAGRLARGRKLLAKRLASRGVVLSAGSLAAVVSQNGASAGVPISLSCSTVKAAALIAAGRAAVAGVVPAKVAALMEGALKGMMLTKLNHAMAGLVVLGAVVFGGSLFMHCTAAGQQQYSPFGQTAPPKRDAGTVAEAAVMQGVPKTDLDRLQGIWSVVSIEDGGKPAELEKAVFMVDGKRACWQTSQFEMQGGLYLDPTGKPRTYDFVMSERTIEGIYSLDGDNLRLCQGTKRPVGFDTQKDREQVLFVLKRIHGPEVFPFRLPDGTRAFPPVIERPNKDTPPPQVAPTPKDNKSTSYNRPAEKDTLPVQAGKGKRMAEEAEEKKLQGSWTLVSIELLGENIPVASLDLRKITFQGNQLVFKREMNPTETFTFRIDAGQNPHRLNLIWLDGPLKGETTTMIYRMDGAKLRLAPADSKQMPSSLTLERTQEGKPAEQKPPPVLLQIAPTPKDNNKYDFGSATLGTDQPPETKDRQQEFLVKVGQDQQEFLVKVAQDQQEFPVKVGQDQQEFPVKVGQGKRFSMPLDHPDFPVKPGEGKRFTVESHSAQSDKPTGKDLHTKVKEEPTGNLLFGTSPNSTKWRAGQQQPICSSLIHDVRFFPTAL
jgi:RNA polymerase sigma factor (sigma-70 family)